jgi:hypothetical protein
LQKDFRVNNEIGKREKEIDRVNRIKQKRDRKNESCFFFHPVHLVNPVYFFLVFANNSLPDFVLLL